MPYGSLVSALWFLSEALARLAARGCACYADWNLAELLACSIICGLAHWSNSLSEMSGRKPCECEPVSFLRL